MKRFIILIFIFLSAVSYSQEKKVALIIGNGKYSEFFKPLTTPVNDAKAMDWTLQELGFETIMKTDLNREKMSDVLEEFREKATNADIALFYFSGHGGYTGKDKYFLVPSGEYKNSSTLAGDCYDFESVEKIMEETGARLKLFFIDACRSPLDGSKGWVAFEPEITLNKRDEAKGTAYFFGTSETTVAFVGNGNFSVFTQALLNHFDDPGYFSNVWNSITSEVTSQYKDQRPQRSLSGNFKDFKLNPSNYTLGNNVRHGYATVTVTAAPDNATIKIGESKFTNGAGRKDLAYGKSYDIVITAEGYEPYKNTISVKPGPSFQKRYNHNLQKLGPATITVTSNVSDASVYIDGKYVGPINRQLKTFSGTHRVEVRKNGYYKNYTTIKLDEGNNTANIRLTRDYPWFFESVYTSGNAGILTYHFSPQYQIGFGYLHRLDCTDGKFAVGGMICTSTDLFSQIGIKDSNIPNIGIDFDIITGNTQSKVEYIDLSNMEYSNYVDPYNEARHFDMNSLILGQVAYSPCEGITIDLGAGADYHRDKYWMKEPYAIKKKYTLNSETGEISNLTQEYVKYGSSMMYKDKSSVEFAIRLGTKFFIPLDSSSIVIGGGYIYLPGNTERNTWDACLGICFDF